MSAIERPAAVGDPWPCLEIDRIQRTAPPGPNRSGASVTCLACFLQIEVWQALILSSKERLGCTIGPEAAAFKQAYPNLAVKEFPHEGEPCSARAYHADVSLDNGVP